MSRFQFIPAIAAFCRFSIGIAGGELETTEAGPLLRQHRFEYHKHI
jgi:hypothetical protein